MSTATYVRTRVDRSPRTAGLLVGDLVAILLLVSIGIVQHNGVGELANLGHVFMVAAPFAIGWLLVAFLGGLYTADATTTVVRALSWTIPAWTLAALIGQGLRATEFFPGGTGPFFTLVTIGVGVALVGGWRVVATLLG